MTTTPATETAPKEPAWALVAWREIGVKLHDKVFLVSTVLLVAAVAVIVGVLAFTSNKDKTTLVAVHDPQAAAVVAQMSTAAKQADEHDIITAVPVADAATARAQLMDGQVQAWLHQSDGAWTLTTKGEGDRNLLQNSAAVVSNQQLFDLAQKAGIDPQQVFRNSTVVPEILDGDASKSMTSYFGGLFFGALFMLSAMIFGMAIAQSVVEEKESRIVEILVSTISVRELLVGKILGNTVLALAQMGLIVGTALIGIGFTPYAKLVPSISGALVWYLVFFLVGFLALACLWAAAGAMATRQQDLGSTTTPLTMVVTGAYMAGFLATGQVQTVLSFVPVVSAVVMPVRIIVGTAALPQILVSLAVNLAFAVLMVLVGARIYQRSLLQTGGKLGIMAALKLRDNTGGS